MATTHQPLLDNPRSRSSQCKIAFVLVSLVAIIGSLALISTRITNVRISYAPSGALQLCHKASDPDSCLSIVSEVVPDGSEHQVTGVHLLQMLLRKTFSHVTETINMANGIHTRVNDKREQGAIADCLELMELSKSRLLDSMVALGDESTQSLTDAHTWLSSVLTNHETCLDGVNGASKSIMEPSLKDLIARARTSLAVLVTFSPSKFEELQPLRGKLPSWVTRRDRKLLGSSANAISANVVVAKDGSGTYTTVQAAVDSAPNKSKTRYVIYIKAGTYKETVRIPSAKTNIMLVGDGMSLTLITGSLNVIDGSTTFNSATVAVSADGFIAQDIWFQNTAGPQKHQAVALRVGSDQSVINRCKIDAYQDTLYTISLRQFYRDCYITGTVDYIFGNAAVVFQNCQIVNRLPMSNQFNTVTAQGKTDPNQNTGTSIQSCSISASADLKPVIGTIKSYLGRPWQPYTVTVVMQSTIDNSIDPAGWAPWDGSLYLNTLYYGEYMNQGPGAGTAKRVNWPGYQVITSAAVAAKFTVSQLIQGQNWLPNTGVTFAEGL